MRLVTCVVLALAISGCAGRRVPNDTGVAAGTVQDAPRVPWRTRGDSLESYMGKVRAIQAAARVAQPRATTTVEAIDPALAAALATAARTPTAESHRAVAHEYRRLGVFDREFQHLQRALAIAPREAATFDALARMWRDSGLPHLALADAHRATYYAPDSPVAHNTLGTVLQALGQRDLARRAFERAARLDRHAAYAFNNICYGRLLAGELPTAVAACQRALTVSPSLTAARHNLALALAAGGRTEAARDTFAAGSDRATASYNMGVVHLAQKQYQSAIAAFADAQAARPQWSAAVARARQAAQASTPSED